MIRAPHQFAASAASGGLTTPLPGVVVAVPVSVGQQVAAGEVLMVIEAMKMEHTITAPLCGHRRERALCRAAIAFPRARELSLPAPERGGAG